MSETPEPLSVTDSICWLAYGFTDSTCQLPPFVLTKWHLNPNFPTFDLNHVASTGAIDQLKTRMSLEQVLQSHSIDFLLSICYDMMDVP